MDWASGRLRRGARRRRSWTWYPPGMWPIEGLPNIEIAAWHIRRLTGIQLRTLPQQSFSHARESSQVGDSLLNPRTLSKEPSCTPLSSTSPPWPPASCSPPVPPPRAPRTFATRHLTRLPRIATVSEVLESGSPLLQWVGPRPTMPSCDSEDVARAREAPTPRK
jgi:hypothetical protein